MIRRLNCILMVAVCLAGTAAANADSHPRLLFAREDVPLIKERSQNPQLKLVTEGLMERVQLLLKAPPLLVSLTGRGESDKPGELKGLEAARRLQGRVLNYCMAYTLTQDPQYRDRALSELDHALSNWKIWVDTAHPEPFDLMTGENCMTFGLAYDWLYNDLSPEQRQHLREGAERRGLSTYLAGTTATPPMMWLTAEHNWNPVCNGGAAVLALALEGESELSQKVLDLAVPAMQHYWDHLAPDGGWDEGTGYWTYGHRYALLAAEALRRAGKPGSEAIFQHKGLRKTGYFPIVFNPGRTLSASFGDSNYRAGDPIFYLLGREYQNPDFVWFQDRAGLDPVTEEGWPQEALTLLWRPVAEPWLPEAEAGYVPKIEPFSLFPSIGWALMAPSQPDPPFFLAFKNGSLAANHTHLDLNHLSVGVGETMLLVELGSRPYPADYFHREKRYQYYEISTAGHNTVLIGGRGQRLGEKGKLEDMVQESNYQALTGVADGAYEVAADRVRRHVVFVKKRYWVVLDEIETPTPQTVELRFHTYGKILHARGQREWTLEQGQAALDLVAVLPRQLSGRTTQPTGWIEPVRVLSLKSKRPRTHHLLATLLYPRMVGSSGAKRVRGQQRGKTLKITVDNDEVIFRQTNGGWKVEQVK